MARIIGAQCAFPPHRHSQSDACSLLKRVWPQHEQVIDRLAVTSGVENRCLVLPIERYPGLGGLEQRNAIYIDSAVSLLESALIELQERTKFDWKDVGVIVSTTITGMATPSLDARLMNRLPLPRDVIRTPIFGLGCMGGVASLNRANDLVKARPDRLALVLAVEICSLTFQLGDASMANLVGASLFGDGAAAVLLAGEDHVLGRNGRMEIVGGASTFYPETERVMGWDMIDSGFRLVLGGNVPEIVKANLGNDVRSFLAREDLGIKDVAHVISHPGGPKVLRAVAEALERDDVSLAPSWESLREQGNLSSVSILNVLERALGGGSGLSTGYALALALGPAFNSEVSLMRVVA